MLGYIMSVHAAISGDKSVIDNDLVRGAAAIVFLVRRQHFAGFKLYSLSDEDGVHALMCPHPERHCRPRL